MPPDVSGLEKGEGDRSYWSLAVDHVLDAVGSSRAGLADDEARARLERYGRNRLQSESRLNLLRLAVKQFQSPLIYILLLAAGVSVALDHLVDAAVIAAVLVFNAAVGFFQEYRAEQAIQALQQLARSNARAVRDGESKLVNAEELVPGDVVLLRSGDRVPADCRLLETRGFDADESVLTGESAPVSKSTRPVAPDSVVPDRTSMAFMGTAATRGQARGVVVATGERTELGQVAGSVREIGEVETPLQHRMTRLANLIAIAVLVMGTGMIGVGYALGGDLEELFFTMITLAVSAIPEGLPIVLTVALAVGVNRMARRNAIIRRLPAVETLGSCTTIGSDKTGTLTQNRMTVRRIHAGGRDYEVDGYGHRAGGRVVADGSEVDLENPEHEALRLTLLAGVLANEASIRAAGEEYEADGDPTEVALLMSATWGGLDAEELQANMPEWADIPFESERQFAASYRSLDGRGVMFVKGSPEAVMEMCTEASGLEEFDRERIAKLAREMAADGQRVLAMACRELAGPTDEEEPPPPESLVFLGLQGMIDPPREEARKAVADCQAAGIRVVMITGDHAETARAIAAELGITGRREGDDAVQEGRAVAAMSDEDLRDVVGSASVYARISPRDKYRIVQALQANGEAVAVTGDGVNDAPALKAADIGIAMGRSGTDVAKETADMIIADDNFASIYAAVEEGRFSFDNVRKATFFLISSGVAEVIAVVSSVIFGFSAPFRPVQILWLNVVTNGVQDVALAFEPGEERLMAQPPRPRSEGILSRLLYERTLIAGIWMALGTLLLFLLAREDGASLEEAQTIALTTMVLFQVLHAHNARSEALSVFRKTPWSNIFLLLGSLGAAGLHALVVYWPPAQSVLDLDALGALDLLVILAVAATIVPVMELHKVARNRMWPMRAGHPLHGEAPAVMD